MENEIKLNGTILAESNAAGTEEDPIISRIKPFYTDQDGKVHIALIETLLSCVIDNRGKRLDKIIKELQEAVGLGDGTITDLIQAALNKEIGELITLETEKKDTIVNAINEVHQEVDQKLQYIPIQIDAIQNPETYETKSIYSVHGEISTENGHPYTAEWSHITYFVFGDENRGGGYKNIVGIDYRGKIYEKSQNSEVWTEWQTIATLNDLSNRLTKTQAIYNKGILKNEDLIASAFTNRSFAGVGNNLANAPKSGWMNYLCLDAAVTGSDINRMLAIDSNVKSNLYFTAGNKATEWVRVLDERDFSNISNKNLIINSNFANPVNQRGESNYSSESVGKYSIDRWRISGGSIEVNTNSSISLIHFENSNTTLIFDQCIEENLVGKTVTLSISTNKGTFYKTIKVTANMNSDFIVIDDFYKANIITYSNKIASVRIFSDVTPSQDAWLTVYWIKLELGSEATLFVPPDPVEESKKCKAYYREIVGYQQITQWSGELLVAYNISYDNMRAVPTCKFKDASHKETQTNGGYYIVNNLGVMQTGFTFSISTNDAFKRVRVDARKTNHGLNSNTAALSLAGLGALCLDAEIY